ncbi:MAG: hypothetical protein JKY33_08120 [Bacteroidia bacterium]|nr:hypothetical protein [Bacteroidia bacterium]
MGTQCFSQVKNFKFYSVEDGLAQSQVNSICQDSKGNLWIGTNGGGLSVFNGHSFKNFTEKEGLGSNIINTIIEDRKGRMWFATWGKGITMFDGRSFKTFTIDDGLCDDKFFEILEDRMETCGLDPEQELQNTMDRILNAWLIGKGWRNFR